MNKKLSLLPFVLLLTWVFPAGAYAQSQPMSEEQKLIMEAPEHIIKKDYKGAENIYSQVIRLNGNNADAYIQRGLVRRELGDVQGAAADGGNVVTLANAAMLNNPNDANLFYHRAMGYRLLKKFDLAKEDMHSALRLNNSAVWQTDLKAIELEEKMAKSIIP